MKLSTCIQQFFDQYHYRIKGSSERTLKSYKKTFLFFLPFAAEYHSIKIAELTVDHLSINLILDFLDYLESKRNNTANTRNQRLACLKSFAKMIRLLYPEKRGIAERIIYLPQKRSLKPLIGFLYIEEIFATYKTVGLKTREGFRDYTILHLLADSGARASEIATLNLDYFNIQQKTLGILGKGNKFRLIELERKTTELLKCYILEYRPTPKLLYRQRLFINKHRNGLTRHGIYRLCRKYLSRVLSPKRMKHINPVHSFRHGCAVNMLAQGKSLSDVKNRLGHESIESTKVYLHMDLKNKREVQKRYFRYLQSGLRNDQKIDELIDWENKKETLAWLDSL
jgi:site-specific recombinase XerD